MFSDPIVSLMAAASTRRALTEPQRREPHVAASLAR